MPPMCGTPGSQGPSGSLGCCLWDTGRGRWDQPWIGCGCSWRGFPRPHPIFPSFSWLSIPVYGLPRWLSGKRIHLPNRRCWFDPWVRKIPWKRAWQLNSAFFFWEILWTEETCELQSMGFKMLDMTERLSTAYICMK